MTATMQTSAAPRALSGKALRRLWPVILAGTFLGVGLAAAAGLAQSESYTATAVVLVNPIEGSPYTPGTRGESLINLETEAELVTTDAVAQEAGRDLGTDLPPAALSAPVTVSVPTNTQVLQIGYTDPSPGVAAARAQAFAAAYLSFRSSQAESLATERLQRVNGEIDSVQEALSTATTDLVSAAPGSAQVSYLSQLITVYADQLSTLQAQQADLETYAPNAGEVITPATPPAHPSGLPLWMYLAAGGAIGLLVGGGVAVIRTLTDDRLHRPDELGALGLRLLGTLPALGPDERPLTDDASPAGTIQMYRRLRAAVAVGLPGGRSTLAVSSVDAGGPAAQLAANLALTFARAGTESTLVDCTLGEVSQLFAFADARGLSDVLLEGADPLGLLVRVRPGLRLLPAGTAAAAAADRLLGASMSTAVSTLHEDNELVILAAPAARSADGLAVATVSSAVVLTVSLGRTSRRDLAAACAEILGSGSTVLGAVLTPEPRLERRSPELAGRRPRRQGEDGVPAPAAPVERRAPSPGARQ